MFACHHELDVYLYNGCCWMRAKELRCYTHLLRLRWAPPATSDSAPSLNVNPPIVPMPSRKLAIAVPTHVLNILQPTNAKRNTAKTRNRTHAQSPSTERKQTISFGFSTRRPCRVDSQCISAGHVFRLANRSLLACGALDRDGRVAKGGFVIDALLVLRLEKSGVFHCVHHPVGRVFGVYYWSRTRRRSGFVWG